mmetsp:Transcript_15876/g.52042  ORF Transcript_15876/g.52042 Transcript_15876/m.52042 type:complete len:438 (+) Transcript_15876:1223-2536(+)
MRTLRHWTNKKSRRRLRTASTLTSSRRWPFCQVFRPRITTSCRCWAALVARDREDMCSRVLGCWRGTRVRFWLARTARTGSSLRPRPGTSTRCYGRLATLSRSCDTRSPGTRGQCKRCASPGIARASSRAARMVPLCCGGASMGIASSRSKATTKTSLHCRGAQHLGLSSWRAGRRTRGLSFGASIRDEHCTKLRGTRCTSVTSRGPPMANFSRRRPLTTPSRCGMRWLALRLIPCSTSTARTAFCASPGPRGAASASCPAHATGVGSSGNLGEGMCSACSPGTPPKFGASLGRRTGRSAPPLRGTPPSACGTPTRARRSSPCVRTRAGSVRARGSGTLARRGRRASQRLGTTKSCGCGRSRRREPTAPAPARALQIKPRRPPRAEPETTRKEEEPRRTAGANREREALSGSREPPPTSARPRTSLSRAGTLQSCRS